MYDVTEQVNLKGRKFGRRRTYLRSLERSARSVEFVELNLRSHGDVRAILDIYEEWESDRGGTTSVRDERATLNAALSRLPVDQEIRGTGLRVNGRLTGFAIYDYRDGIVATAHFVKARRQSAEVAGTWQALFASAHQAGATIINGGYDGGLAGLRAAKNSIRPSSMRQAFFIVKS